MDYVGNAGLKGMQVDILDCYKESCASLARGRSVVGSIYGYFAHQRLIQALHALGLRFPLRKAYKFPECLIQEPTSSNKADVFLASKFYCISVKIINPYNVTCHMSLSLQHLNCIAPMFHAEALTSCLYTTRSV